MFCEKIASLALCAVTAASCCLCPWPWPSWPGGSGSSSSSSSSSSAPDIDYSAILEGDLPDGAKKDFITFEDNSADESALQNALGSLSAQATGSVQEGQVTPIYNTSPGYGQTVEDFVKACGIKNTTLKRGNSPDGMYYYFVNNPSLDAAQQTRCAVLYAAPGSLGLEEAMQKVADQMDPVLEKLPATNAPGTPAYHYRYVVSTSAAGSSLPGPDGAGVPVYYIAVTVTRIPTPA